MRVLEGPEADIAMQYIDLAALTARKSCCLRSKCGSVIVQNQRVIGAGYNSPPGDKPLEKCLKDNLPANFKSDKSCCIHAEQRAIIDALKHYPELIEGSTLYFIRLDENDKKKHSGRPYCTICSKMALDAGIAEFVLWHKEGITVYNTEEYNELSFQYRE
jgi:dCMP deaminase